MHITLILPSEPYIDRIGRIPFGPINNIKQTFEHPQGKARNVVVEIEVSLSQLFFATKDEITV